MTKDERIIAAIQSLHYALDCVDVLPGEQHIFRENMNEALHHLRELKS